MPSMLTIHQLRKSGFRHVALREDGWSIFADEDGEGAGWVRVRLRRDGIRKRSGVRRAYCLAWNGSRFAESSDMNSAPADLIFWAQTEMSKAEVRA